MSNFLYNPYNGNVSLTNHGHTCVSWAVVALHMIDADSYFDGDGNYLIESANYCRQTKSTDLLPWCFIQTTEESVLSWEYCSFTICSGIYEPCREKICFRGFRPGLTQTKL